MDSADTSDDRHPGTLAASSRALGYLDMALVAFAAVSVFCLMIFGVVEILLGVVFRRSINGYLDILEQSMAIFAFLGAAFAQHTGAHIRMEMLIGALKGRKIWIAELIGTLIGIFVLAVIILYSWNYFLSAYQIGDSTSDIEMPTWPSKLAVPVAFTIWMLRLVIQAIGFIRLIIDPDAQPIAVPTIKAAAEQAREEIEALGEDAKSPTAAGAAK